MGSDNSPFSEIEGTIQAARAYGIPTTLDFTGRSDHMAFHEARVPAAMLIYWPDPLYHSPEDKIPVVEPDKLKTVGVLSAHTLAALAEGYVELEQAVERSGTKEGNKGFVAAVNAIEMANLMKAIG